MVHVNFENNGVTVIEFHMLATVFVGSKLHVLAMSYGAKYLQ